MFSASSGPTVFGVNVILVATILAALAVGAVLVAMAMSVMVGDPMHRRVKALTERREELKAGLASPSPKRRAHLVHENKTVDWMRGLLARLRVLQDSQVAVVQHKLAHAGIRNKEWAVAVIFFRMVAPVVLGLLAAAIVYWANYFPDWGSMKRFMAFAAAVGLGYRGPEIYISNLSTKRTAAIRKGLPDALDLLVICAEAGLTVDAAFGRVAKELGRAYPELGDEFTLTAIELAFLHERRQAFENLAYRVNLDALRGVVTTMIQTERYGTPLASALRVLSAEFRNERMMRAEEKAARLPAIMTVPLIMFILPVLFVVILGPAACAISDGFLHGKN
jgi:tight adherence protein C